MPTVTAILSLRNFKTKLDMRHRPKRENYPRGVYGEIDYQERLERYCTYLENRNKELTEQCNIAIVSKSFTYKDISKVAEELANEYTSDKKDPVWRDIRQDGIKAIQAFISKHM